jgi:hypothetical protein
MQSRAALVRPKLVNWMRARRFMVVKHLARVSRGQPHLQKS